MSIAVAYTFLPDSQRETVFAPRRSRRARSAWLRSNRSRIARISSAESSPCFLAVDRDRILAEPLRVLEAQQDLSAPRAPEVGGGRDRDLFAVDR